MRGMTGAAAARGVGKGGIQTHAAGGAGKQQQPSEERRGRQVAGMTDYWQALCSGLDAGAEAYSDVEGGNEGLDSRRQAGEVVPAPLVAPNMARVEVAEVMALLLLLLTHS